MRELKLRGFVRRTLVIAPKGLVTQWIAEMQTHFGEEFRFFSPPDFTAYRRIAPSENVWRAFDQVICSLDSVKPIEARQGWSQEDINGFNKERFEDLVTAGWDLIIVDESHRIGGTASKKGAWSCASAAPSPPLPRHRRGAKQQTPKAQGPRRPRQRRNRTVSALLRSRWPAIGDRGGPVPASGAPSAPSTSKPSTDKTLQSPLCAPGACLPELRRRQVSAF